MPTAQDILTVARSLIGVHETPPSSNIAHPITDWAAAYGWSAPDAWCAWTQSYAFWHVPGGKELIHGVATGGSWVFRDNGIKYGEIIGGPLPGAIDVMKFASDTTGAPTSHVGIVESVNRDGTWTNIEGNHEDQVMRVPRSAQAGTQHWFIMPKYSSTPQPIPQEVDMGLAQVEKQLNAGEAWETSGFVLEARKARTDLDIINKGSVPMNASVGIQKPNGDFGAYYVVVPVSKGATPGSPATQGMKNLEVGEVYKDKNLGNIILWIHVDQPATVIKSQELT